MSYDGGIDWDSFWVVIRTRVDIWDPNGETHVEFLAHRVGKWRGIMGIWWRMLWLFYGESHGILMANCVEILIKNCVGHHWEIGESIDELNVE